MSTRLSPPQSFALSCLALGPLKYTVAGYTAATQANASMGATYIKPQTIAALERRGFARVRGPLRQRRAWRAWITLKGVRLVNGGGH